MKRGLLICWTVLTTSLASAQDFISLYMTDYEADSNLSIVTISPKMMEEILHRDAKGNPDILNVISGLKSMRAVSSSLGGDAYYNSALKILEKNNERFDLCTSYTSDEEDFRIVVRKNKKQIVEMVMLLRIRGSFIAMSFTGDIKPEFISALEGTLKPEEKL